MTLEERLDAHDEYVRLLTQVLLETDRRLDAHDEKSGAALRAKSVQTYHAAPGWMAP